MSSVKDIVEVILLDQGGTVVAQSFGIPTIVGSTQEDVFRTTRYSDPDEMLEDGFTSTDPEYKMAALLYKAKVKPAEFIVGQTASTDATFTESLSAIKESDGAMFAFGCVTRVIEDQKLAADWAESQEFAFYFVAENRDGCIGGTTVVDTVTAYAFANGYTKTAALYHEDADTLFAEGGLIGAFITKVPGSYTVKFKDIIGLIPSDLTTAQQAAAKAQKCNVFMDKSGNGTLRFILEGTTTGEKFIDEVVFEAWVKANISAEILTMYKQNDIVPYDNVGIALNEKCVRTVLDTGITNGGITSHAFNADGDRTGGYTVSSPDASEIPGTVKQTREYNNYTKFEYFKRNAMHGTKITGYILS